MRPPAEAHQNGQLQALAQQGGQGTAHNSKVESENQQVIEDDVQHIGDDNRHQGLTHMVLVLQPLTDGEKGHLKGDGQGQNPTVELHIGHQLLGLTEQSKPSAGKNHQHKVGGNPKVGGVEPLQQPIAHFTVSFSPKSL